MKIIVQSTNPAHGLMNDDGQYLVSHRPCVAKHTLFLGSRIGAGAWKVLVGNLDDAATDDEFAKYLKEANGETQFAIDAFEAAYSTEPNRRAVDADAMKKERDSLLAEEARKAQEQRDADARATNEAMQKKADEDKAEADRQAVLRKEEEERLAAAASKELADKEAADKAAAEEAAKTTAKKK